MSSGARTGRPVGSDGAVTRARLLRSAREVFSERGYEKTTAGAVAEGAGLTRTAFYRYFDSKAALRRALIDDTNFGYGSTNRCSITGEHAAARGAIRARRGSAGP